MEPFGTNALEAIVRVIDLISSTAIDALTKQSARTPVASATPDRRRVRVTENASTTVTGRRGDTRRLDQNLPLRSYAATVCADQGGPERDRPVGRRYHASLTVCFARTTGGDPWRVPGSGCGG